MFDYPTWVLDMDFPQLAGPIEKKTAAGKRTQYVPVLAFGPGYFVDLDAIVSADKTALVLRTR